MVELQHGRRQELVPLAVHGLRRRVMWIAFHDSSDGDGGSAEARGPGAGYEVSKAVEDEVDARGNFLAVPVGHEPEKRGVPILRREFRQHAVRLCHQRILPFLGYRLGPM